MNLVPKPIDYKDLTYLIIVDSKNRIPSLGYKHRKGGNTFYFTFKGTPVKEAIEVVASEYSTAYSEDGDNDE